MATTENHQTIGTKLYRNKRLQHHILALRQSHADLLSETKQLKRDLNERCLLLKNGGRYDSRDEQICQIAQQIYLNKSAIQQQSQLLKMYKNKNADFHRRYHGAIVERKNNLKRYSFDVMAQIRLQTAIAKNKVQLNPQTSSLPVDERLALADKQHLLKKRLRDHNW